MVGLAHASDGGGSIRAPAAACGLFGLKPQRGRVSLLPDLEHWKGLSVYGAVTRTVADTALYLDVVAGPAPGNGEPSPPSAGRSFAEAAATAPGRLRIAVSARTPVPQEKVDPQVRRALDDTATLLRSLGHDVREADPDFGPRPLITLFGPRYLRGAKEDYDKAERPKVLERRVRGLVRLAALTPEPVLARARKDAEAWTRQVLGLWDDYDVLLQPAMPRLPNRLNEQEGYGTLRMMVTSSRFVAYTAPWNITGQPAAAVPAGWSVEGLPLSVQMVGRPNDEATLLSLGAQIERERPWADRLPPLA
jgi:amidase